MLEYDCYLNIIRLHQKNNVKIIQNSEIQEIIKTKTEKELKLSNGVKKNHNNKKSVKTDILLICPNNQSPNTAFAMDEKKTLDIERDYLVIDKYCRSNVKRIFGAGTCTITQPFFSNLNVKNKK